MTELMEFYLDNCTETYQFRKTKSELAGFPNLSQPIKTAIQTYWSAKQGKEIEGLYKLVLKKVEVPLLQSVLERTHYNQTHTALILGLNRGTLRKKMKQHNLLIL